MTGKSTYPIGLPGVEILAMHQVRWLGIAKVHPAAQRSIRYISTISALRQALDLAEMFCEPDDEDNSQEIELSIVAGTIENGVSCNCLLITPRGSIGRFVNPSVIVVGHSDEAEAEAIST